MTWKELKKRGNPKYKGYVEPVDLFRAGGILRHFAIGSIIKYAYRNRKKINRKDIRKIIHYAQMLLVLGEEDET